MDGNLRLDRDILVAISTGTISIIGICLVLFMGLRQDPEAMTVTVPTATPFKYLLLATETHTPDPALAVETPEGSLQREPNAPTIISTPGTDPSEIGTLPETNDDPISTSETPTADETQMMTVGKYDDTDTRIIYYGDWSSEVFVDLAFEETIYISALPGDTVTFTFMGRQLVLGYLGSSDFDLGTATIAIDSNPFQLDQASGNSWTSPQLLFDQHTAVITHQTGEMLFLDYIEIR